MRSSARCVRQQTIRSTRRHAPTRKLHDRSNRRAMGRGATGAPCPDCNNAQGEDEVPRLPFAPDDESRQPARISQARSPRLAPNAARRPPRSRTSWWRTILRQLGKGQELQLETASRSDDGIGEVSHRGHRHPHVEVRIQAAAGEASMKGKPLWRHAAANRAAPVEPQPDFGTAVLIIELSSAGHTAPSVASWILFNERNRVPPHPTLGAVEASS
jgi:hypothetical protein